MSQTYTTTQRIRNVAYTEKSNK